MAPLSDSALTASSIHDSNHGTQRSRLNTEGSYGAWSTLTNIPDEYIQADFGETRAVQRVALQGRWDTDQWVTEFKFSYAVNNPAVESNWEYILDGSGNERVFAGVSDRNTIVEHDFTPTLARYVRVHPTAWLGHISLRWEVYGCEPSFSNEWGMFKNN